MPVYLPSFVGNYLNHLTVINRSERTIKVYRYELTLFLIHLCQHKDGFPKMPESLTMNHIQQVTHRDIEAFLSDARVHRHNGPAALARKQAAIQSLFHYLVKEDLLKVDVTVKLDTVKVPERVPVALEPNEVASIVEKLNRATLRNKAIIFTLLGTGLRVSELCGLDVIHVDFQKSSLSIIGKGDRGANVYFGEDVATVLKDYLDNERSKKAVSPALFLSKRKTRISVDMVEIIVEQYTGLSPHKMRSTAATMLLRETGNMALVQDFLRHKDPRTTRRYTKILDEELRRAAQRIRLT